jgi:hypothetical protein
LTSFLEWDWLSKHNVLIDYAKKSVKLMTLDRKELKFIAKPVVTAKGAANHVKVNQMDTIQGSEVPVVNEFPDVFPKELPSMPPDRDIEFVIELKPGTCCRSKPTGEQCLNNTRSQEAHVAADGAP